MYCKKSYAENSTLRFIQAWWQDKKRDATPTGSAEQFLTDNLDSARAIHTSFQNFRNTIESSTTGLTRVHVGFVGFGEVGLRNAICSLFRYYLRTRLLHCTMTAPGRFEGIFTVDLSNTEDALSDLQQACDMCRAGLVLIDLGSYMSAPMSACLRRVLEGRLPWGNLMSRKNAMLYRDFQTFAGDHHMPSPDTTHAVTGLRLSEENMLGLFHRNRMLSWQVMALSGADSMWQQYHRRVVLSHAQLARQLSREVGEAAMTQDVRAAAEAHAQAVESLPWL